ncbi:MAG: hypothetical protein H6849_00820 [Alphaproteobacteria bacterium]|nr:MAG: hypothetical protein H6849_00820 [Alphaproteobacteria bacterium]
MRDKIERLKELSLCGKPEAIFEFERILVELGKDQRIEILKELFSVFDDRCQDTNMLYSLTHVVERFPDEIYLKTLVLGICDMGRSDMRWLKFLFYRILNDPPSYSSFKKFVREPDPSLLTSFLNKINQESPEHRQQVEELKQIIGSK